MSITYQLNNSTSNMSIRLLPTKVPMIILFFTIGLTVFVKCQNPTDPTPCTNENKGHCVCGDESKGFHTYTFWIGDLQRCFTVFHPLSRQEEALPVFFLSNCYAKDKLSGLDMTNENSAKKDFTDHEINIFTNCDN